MPKEKTKDGSEEQEEKKPNWVKTTPAEMQKLVVDLAQKGNTPSKIGIILRDQQSIPKSKLLGKKITKILKEAGRVYITEKDITDKKIEKLKSHIEKHKHDYTAKKSLTKQLWSIYHLERQQ